MFFKKVQPDKHVESAGAKVSISTLGISVVPNKIDSFEIKCYIFVFNNIH